MSNQEIPKSNQINWDHIKKYKWPIPLEARKRNIKKLREIKQMHKHVKELPGPVIISGKSKL